MSVLEQFQKIRTHTLQLTQGLSPEVLGAQPAPFVSPAKWHLAHTTWFFEQLFLVKHQPQYQVFNPHFNYLFNSYYQSVGERIDRAKRGLVTRPALGEVLEYRQHVEEAVLRLTADELTPEMVNTLALGLQHEMQHQELLLSDLKYILGQQPLKEALPHFTAPAWAVKENSWHSFKAQLTTVGQAGPNFGFDNEKPPHQVYLTDFAIQTQPVTNAEWLEFIEAGGYQKFQFWHAEGWDWLQAEKIKAPLYWFTKDGQWWEYTVEGFNPLEPTRPVAHISFYEAFAYAQWRGARLPTEAEWEHAADQLNWGARWEWTNSAYLPYPGYLAYQAEAGEYNAKFMVNQMVLRGASIFTPQPQKRKTYRNFFHAHERWQCTGLRLAKN